VSIIELEVEVEVVEVVEIGFSYFFKRSSTADAL
jgi:hypothetical protein